MLEAASSCVIGQSTPSLAPTLPCDSCLPRPSSATLDLWRSPTDSCSTLSARRPSSIRRSWPSFSVSRTRRSSRPDQPAGRWHRRERQPRHRPSTIEPETPPDRQWHQAGAELLGFATPSDFVHAYPISRKWLTLLLRRMDAVAGVYRLASSMSLGIDGLRSRVEFHRRGRFDATITPHDGRSFGVVRQDLALRRRSLYDRLRAIADATPGPLPRGRPNCTLSPDPRGPARDLCRADGHCTA